jgi:hypothetical protein
LGAEEYFPAKGTLEMELDPFGTQGLSFGISSATLFTPLNSSFFVVVSFSLLLSEI